MLRSISSGSKHGSRRHPTLNPLPLGARTRLVFSRRVTLAARVDVPPTPCAAPSVLIIDMATGLLAASFGRAVSTTLEPNSRSWIGFVPADASG